MKNANYDFIINKDINYYDNGSTEESYVIDFDKHLVSVEHLTFDELYRFSIFLNKYIEEEKKIIDFRKTIQGK